MFNIEEYATVGEKKKIECPTFTIVRFTVFISLGK